MRYCNERGVQLLRDFEGLRLTAYKCPAGFWTVGYGHTLSARAGQKITRAEAELLLGQDLQRFEQGITRLVTVPLTSNQFSALVCFTFNIGLTAFENSTLRRLLNRCWYSQVPTQMRRWDKANGKVLPGLARRRLAEAALWNLPNDPIQPLLPPPAKGTIHD